MIDNYGDFQYIDTALGSHRTRNTVIPISELIEAANRADIGENLHATQWLRSWCRFDVNFLRHVNKTGSVKGYKGQHIFDFLFIDIDGDKDAENPLIEANDKLKKFLESWSAYGTQKDLEIYFSSGKGYHVYIPAGLFMPVPHENLMGIARKFVEGIMPTGEVSLTGVVDPNNFEQNRLIKLPSTKGDNGKFKILLTDDEVESALDDPTIFEEIALTPRTVNYGHLTGGSYWNYETNDKLVDLWEESTSKAKDKGAVRIHVGTAGKARSFQQTPYQCINNILAGITDGGPEHAVNKARNPALFALASYYRKTVANDDALFWLIQGYNQQLPKPLPEHEIKTIIKSSAEYGGWGCCSDSSGLHALSYCNPDASLEKCPRHKKTERNWHRADEALTSLETSVQTNASPWTFGIPELDRQIGFLERGNCIAVQGVAGLGKTKLKIRLMRHMIQTAKDQDEIVVFLSPEMETKRSLEKTAMQEGFMNRGLIYEEIVAEGRLRTEVREYFLKYADNLVFVKSAGFSVKDIIATVKDIEETTGKKVGVILYDGVQFIKAEIMTGIKEAEVAAGLIDYCNQEEIIGIFAVHLPKSEVLRDGMAPEEVRPSRYSGKGTTMWADRSDFVLSLYKRKGKVMLATSKMRETWDGRDELPDIPFLVDNFYNLHTESEALALGEAHFQNSTYEDVFINDESIEDVSL
jgi:hypothetical protein